MTSAQVVETSVKVTTNSPSQDYTHPDDHNLRTYDITNELLMSMKSFYWWVLHEPEHFLLLSNASVMSSYYLWALAVITLK